MDLILNFIEYKLVGFYFFIYALFCIICALACVGVIGEIETKRKVKILQAKREARIAEEEKEAKEVLARGTGFKQEEAIIDPTLAGLSKAVKKSAPQPASNAAVQQVPAVSQAQPAVAATPTVNQATQNTGMVPNQAVAVDNTAPIPPEQQEVPAVLDLDAVKPVDSK